MDQEIVRNVPGTVVDDVEIEITRGKIAEFVRATRLEDPVHSSPGAASDAGFADVPAPLTFTVVTGHQRDQAGFVARLGLDIRRIVVGSVSWEYRRPLLAGERLLATRRVVSDESRAGSSGSMRLVTLETEFADPSRAIAAVQREVLIERGTAS